MNDEANSSKRNHVRDRVLEMLAAKQITAEEAELLLAAIEHEGQRAGQWLADPFSRRSIERTLALAGVVAGLAMALSRFGIVFDGALDMHIVPEPHSWGRTCLETLVSWPLVALCLWLTARVLRWSGRLVDFLAVVGFARLPLVLSGPVVLLILQFGGGDPVDATVLALVMLLAMPLTILTVAWLYKGFSLVAGRRGGLAGVVFAGGLIAAEILSRQVLSFFS